MDSCPISADVALWNSDPRMAKSDGSILYLLQQECSPDNTVGARFIYWCIINAIEFDSRLFCTLWRVSGKAVLFVKRRDTSRGPQILNIFLLMFRSEITEMAKIEAVELKTKRGERNSHP